MICWIEPKGKIVIKSTGNAESFALRVLEQRYQQAMRNITDELLTFIVFDHSYEQLPNREEHGKEAIPI